MNVCEIISKKQAAAELSTAEIEYLISGYTQGLIPDYQMAALLMTVYFKGMTFRETADLLRSMISSGKTVDLSSIPERKVDKHSTGGVGDKVSLIVAPIVAALGVPVPMISGRALGHSGGTLDKLESIPGFTTGLTIEQFVRQVQEIGCALIGQTEEIVPADRKIYALRDVTSTVRSIPLVTASIMSKKIAEGIDALLLDVKFGRGAFFPEITDARQLAKTLVSIGEMLGLEVCALLTDMDQPLGNAVGNWLEVRECLDIMRGADEARDLIEIALAESALMLIMGGKANHYSEAYHLAVQALETGKALAKFIEIAEHQQADVSYLIEPDKYRQSSCRLSVKAKRNGYITGLDALAIGEA
ncbi:MAG: thymidine phosphorylase, partial [bacterium]